MRWTVLMVLAALTACGEDEPACDEAVVSCDGTVLQECVDGELVDVEDCADEGMICHEEHGHCMLDGGTTEHM